MPKLYLFSLMAPEGEIFNSDDEGFNEEAMAKDGWVDSPAKLDLPPAVVDKTADEVANLTPDDYVRIVRELGLTVLNDFELESLKHSMKLELAKEPITTVVDTVPTKALTREELVILGAKHGVKLKMTQKEQTMIDLINDKLKADELENSSQHNLDLG